MDIFKNLLTKKKHKINDTLEQDIFCVYVHIRSTFLCLPREKIERI